MRAALGIAVITAATVSCSDALAPTTDLIVAIGIDSVAAPVITDTPNGPQIVCTVRFAATARGTGTATWRDAAAYWYTGAERTTPTDTTSIRSADLAATFAGHESISAGETQHATWYFVGAAPFDLAMDFAYARANGSTESARTRYRCGPDPATAVAPVVTRITVPSPTGELAAGDTVSVSYQETSSSGVWMTIIAASGAFTSAQRTGEGFATSVDRTVKFVVPAHPNTGVPLTITVQAYDAALQTRARTVVTELQVAAP
jgi:hypothetical protein